MFVLCRHHRLEKVGFDVGIRVLELLSYREKVLRRKTDVLDILRFIHGPAWQYLFGKTADDLQQAASVSFLGKRVFFPCSWQNLSYGRSFPMSSLYLWGKRAHPIMLRQCK